MRKFEYDEEKSEFNKSKHGIDFIQAQLIWMDPRFLDFIPATYDNEHRWNAVGKINGLFWTATYTERGDVIRIISVRRSRKHEKEAYYAS